MNFKMLVLTVFIAIFSFTLGWSTSHVPSYDNVWVVMFIGDFHDTDGKIDLDTIRAFEGNMRDFSYCMVSNLGIPRNHIHLESSFSRGIKWLKSKSKSRDLVIVHFSSHGVPECKKWWWGPVPKWNRCLKRQGWGLQLDKKYHFDQIASELDRIKYQHMVVIVDSCFSGGIIPYLKADNRWIFTATAKDELEYGNRLFLKDSPASDFSKMLFTANFISALKASDTWNRAFINSQANWKQALKAGKYYLPHPQSFLPDGKDLQLLLKKASYGADLQVKNNTGKEILALIRCLGDRHRDVRYIAVKSLGEKGPAAASAVPALTNVLNDNDKWVRKIAAEALGKIGLSAAEAVPALMNALNDPYKEVRMAAAQALGKIDPAAIKAIAKAHLIRAQEIQPLIRDLADMNENVKKESGRALFKISRPTIFLALIKALDHKRRDVRMEASDVLYVFLDDKRCREATAEAFYVLQGLSSAAISALAKPLNCKDREVRMAATMALGVLGPAAVRDLIRTLGDENREVRFQAAIGLSKIFGEMTMKTVRESVNIDSILIPTLTKAMGSEDRDVRKMGILALGLVGPAAIPALTKAMGSEDRDVRKAAVPALGLVGPAAIPALTKALSDENERVRCSAAEELGKMGPSGAEAVSALVKSLFDQNESVSIAAAEALGLIGSAASASVSDLIQALDDHQRDKRPLVEGGLRVAAAETLGRIGETAIPALIEAMGHEDKDVRYLAASALADIGPAAAPAVPALIRALSDEKNVRYKAAWALGKIGTSAAVSALTDILDGDDREMREYAAEVLPFIGPAAVPALIKAIGHKHKVVRKWVKFTFEKLGPRAVSAVPALISALSQENLAVREMAAGCLSYLGPAAAPAVPALTKALSDENLDLRLASIETLSYIGPAAAPAVPALTKALSDKEKRIRREAVDSLGAIGPAAVPALVKALGHWDRRIRIYAVCNLRDIGKAAKAAIPALTEMRESEDRGIRRLAAEALEKIKQ